MQRTLKIKLNTNPNDKRPVYLVGNFNNWQVSDPTFLMKEKSNGKFEFTFKDFNNLPDFLEFKFIKGTWMDAELDDNGLETYNRKIEKVADTLKFEIHRWKGDEFWYQPQFLPKIVNINEPFEIPQLIKTRRITALLPHDYFDSNKHYPVLYLQDGQNLFDDYAPFGSWGVDKKLANLAEKGRGDLIVISIDHAKEQRISEFTPSGPTKLGVGDGRMYAKFLSEVLKPYVDKNFRTRPQRECTGIGGSSMGGLISIYAAMMHPESYSLLMIFSPSLWVSPQMAEHFIQRVPNFNGRIYLYGGGKEGSGMIPLLKSFEELVRLKYRHHISVKLNIDPQGHHNEQRWGKEFPVALEWLYPEHVNA